MTRYRYFAMLLTAVVFGACSSDSSQQEEHSPIISQTNEPVPVEFTVAAQRNYDFTRSESSIVTFNSGETVKVCVKPNGATDYTGYNFTTASAGQSDIALNSPAGNNKPYFPAGPNTTVQAYAYYPSTAGDNSTFSVADNQTSDAAYKASDLMYAANRTITKGSDDGTLLKMDHKMAQLKVTAHAQDGSGITIKRVKVTAQKSVTFAPGTGATTTTGSNGDILALNGEGTGYVLIPVQAVNNVSVKVETDDAGTPTLTAVYGFTALGDFEAGNSYSIDLTVTAAQVGTMTAIADWNGAGSLVIAPTGDLTISTIAPQTYNGSALTPRFDVYKDGTKLTENTDYSIQYLRNTNAGTAYVVVMGKGTYEGSVGVTAFVINKLNAAITYNTTSMNKTYGDAAFTNALLKTGDGTVTYASSDTDVATVNATTGQVTIQNTGTATITATVVDGDNYTYPTPEVSYTLTVGKKSITTNDITLSSQTLTYNAGSQTRIVAAVGGLTDGNNWTVTNNTGTNAGNYTLTVTMAESCKNYKGSATASWTIGKRTLTITAKAQTINYGQSIATGTGQINYSGQVSGHSVTDIKLSQNTSNATTNGTITPSNATVKDGSSNTVTSNYDIKYNGGKLVINKVAATLTCNTDAISFAQADGVGSTKTKTGVSYSGGTINVSSNNTSNCTVSISGSTITVTRQTVNAFTNTAITVSVTPDGNHTAPSSKTINVSAVANKVPSTITCNTAEIRFAYTEGIGSQKFITEVSCDGGTIEVGTRSTDISVSFSGSTITVTRQSGNHFTSAQVWVKVVPDDYHTESSVGVIVKGEAPPSGTNKFSISTTQKVIFSKGNLQLTGENTWKFADNQWETFGNDQYDNHRDRFSWGTGDNPNKTGGNNGDYSSFTDWGNNISGGWFTLSADQWNYLIKTRRVIDSMNYGGNRTYNYTEVNGVWGLVIYPDDHTGAFYEGSDWSTFEAAGCIFLPGDTYWSSSAPANPNYGNCITYSSNTMSPTHISYRSWTNYVRLVRY